MMKMLGCCNKQSTIMLSGVVLVTIPVYLMVVFVSIMPVIILGQSLDQITLVGDDGQSVTINLDRVDSIPNPLVDDILFDDETDTDDAPDCTPIHDVLVDIGAKEFSDILKANGGLDFKYGEFTIFAPTDRILKVAEAKLADEGYDSQTITDVALFHIAPNIIEDTILDDPSKCGQSLIMLNKAMDVEKQESSVTNCDGANVFQIGPGNSKTKPLPQIFGTAIEACNGVVFTINDAVILPTLSRETAPKPSTMVPFPNPTSDDEDPMVDYDPSVAETCSICPNGFDTDLSDFVLLPPKITGLSVSLSCEQISAMVGNYEVGSNACTWFKIVQGFCCPKCFVCGTFENDLAMTKYDAIVSPETGLSCGKMASLYTFLSYTAPNSCPDDVSDLQVPNSRNVALGLEIRGYCGCPGFEDSKPDPQVTYLCPAGKEVSAMKDDIVLVPDTTFTCAEADNLAAYITDRDAYEAQGTVLTYGDACCTDVNEEVNEGINEDINEGVNEGVNEVADKDVVEDVVEGDVTRSPSKQPITIPPLPDVPESTPGDDLPTLTDGINPGGATVDDLPTLIDGFTPDGNVEESSASKRSNNNISFGLSTTTTSTITAAISLLLIFLLSSV